MNLVIIFLLALHFASALALTQSSYGIAVREPEEAENEAGGDSPTYKMRIVPRAVQQNAWYIYYSFHERGRAGTSRIFVGAGLDLRGQRLETLDRPALQNRVQQLTQEYVRPVSQLLAARFPDFAFVVDEVSNGFSSGTWGIVGIEIMSNPGRDIRELFGYFGVVLEYVESRPHTMHCAKVDNALLAIFAAGNLQKEKLVAPQTAPHQRRNAQCVIAQMLPAVI